MLKKQYLKSRPVCKVTFKILKKDIGPARHVSLTGEFNNWDQSACPMKRLKNGDFTLKMDLKKGETYQFKYVVDHEKWINDDHADAYHPSPYPGVENSLLIL